MGIESIAKQVARTNTGTTRTDLPPLHAYDGLSLWAEQVVDEETGEVTSGQMQYLQHSIGKTGAGLNAALDRILDSFAKRGNKGYNELEGFEFVVMGVTPVVAFATPKAPRTPKVPKA